MAGIYLYWEGADRHWYYDLCLRTVLAHNPTARVLGRADAEAVVGPLPPELDAAYVVHRVDWVRKAFVERVGGLWVDMDFVCLRPLAPLAGLAAAFDYVGYKEWHGSWMDNLFAARAGSPVLAAARDFALDQVRAQGAAVRWLATNTEAMDHALGRHPWCNYLQVPTHVVSPVSVNEPHWFRAPAAPGELDGYAPLGFMTSYHTLRHWLAGQTEAGFLAGPSRLAALVRRALG